MKDMTAALQELGFSQGGVPGYWERPDPVYGDVVCHLDSRRRFAWRHVSPEDYYYFTYAVVGGIHDSYERLRQDVLRVLSMNKLSPTEEDVFLLKQFGFRRGLDVGGFMNWHRGRETVLFKEGWQHLGTMEKYSSVWELAMMHDDDFGVVKVDRDSPGLRELARRPWNPLCG